MTVPPTGPWLEIAAFCERVEQTPDGLLTLHNVYDAVTMTLAGPALPDEMPEFVREITLQLKLMAGSALGRHTVRVDIERPDTVVLRGPPLPIHFDDAPDRGATMTVRMNIPFRQEGVHWFRVLFNESLLTRLPLRVRYRPLVGAVSVKG